MLVVAAYRSDEIGRGASAAAAARRPAPRPAAARARRRAARRSREHRELAARVLGERAVAGAGRRDLRPHAGRAVLRRRSSPRALQAGDRVCARARPVSSSPTTATCPVPETIRDAVLLRTAGLSAEGRAAAEAAAVAGAEFALDLVAGLCDELGSPTGLIAETEPGRAAFRHALVRGAIYEDIQWLRRRELHASLAERLEPRAGAERRDRRALAAPPATASARSTRYLAAARELAARPRPPRRGARRAGRRSTCGPRARGRRSGSAALDAYAQLAPSWRATSPRRARCARPRERSVAGGAAARRGRRGGAARRRRAAARGALRAAGRPRARARRAARRGRLVRRRRAARRGGGRAAAASPPTARAPAAMARRSSWPSRPRTRPRRAERIDLRARALGLEGVARAKRGEFAAGVETIRAGLSLALEHELTPRPPSSTSGSPPRSRPPPTTAARARRSTRRSGCARRPAPPARSTPA